MTDNENNIAKRSPPTGSDYLAEIIKSISAQPIANTPKQEDTPKDTAAPASATPDILSSLLSNPELLSKLPTIISTVKPIMEMLSSSAAGGGAASAPSSAPSSVPTFSPSPSSSPSDGNDAVAASASHPHRRGDDRRAALLCALKPYLSSDRRQAIDYIIKLDRLGDVLKTL